MSIIEFTTLTGREKARVLLGSSIKGVFAEIYLDELARVLDTAMKLKPNLDFHVLVEIFLNPTILHEIITALNNIRSLTAFSNGLGRNCKAN